MAPLTALGTMASSLLPYAATVSPSQNLGPTVATTARTVSFNSLTQAEHAGEARLFALKRQQFVAHFDATWVARGVSSNGEPPVIAIPLPESNTWRSTA
jgi:hypothetical protein